MAELYDYVLKAIEKGNGIKNSYSIPPQTWTEFQRTVGTDKKICIWGAGNGFLPCMYSLTEAEKGQIICFIDNDKSKQKQKINDYWGAVCDSCNGEFVGESILSNLEDDHTVFLITNLRNIDSVVKNISERGFHHIFSFLQMEIMASDERKSLAMCSEIQMLHAKNVMNNSIVFTSHIHGQHNWAIINELVKLVPNLKLFAIVSEISEQYPDYVEQVPIINIIKVIEAFSMSKIWLIDLDTPPEYIIKKSNQIYIQVKHWASITLKKFGVENRQASRNNHMWNNLLDYIIVGSDFDIKSCKMGFEFEDPYLNFGSPRSDLLFKKNEDALRIKNGLELGVNYILYAPTFRTIDGVRSVGIANEIDYESVYSSLRKRFGGEWKIILKLHPAISNLSRICELPSYVVDKSKGADIEELVSVSECMITDYSSVMFEPAFVGKKVFLYAPDLNHYLTYEKDLLMDYRELPFPIACSVSELISNIKSFDEEEYKKKLTAFLDFHGVHEDGRASERAALFIKDLMNDELKEISYYEKYLR